MSLDELQRSPRWRHHLCPDSLFCHFTYCICQFKELQCWKCSWQLKEVKLSFFPPPTSTASVIHKNRLWNILGHTLSMKNGLIYRGRHMASPGDGVPEIQSSAILQSSSVKMKRCHQVNQKLASCSSLTYIHHGNTPWSFIFYHVWGCKGPWPFFLWCHSSNVPPAQWVYAF